MQTMGRLNLRQKLLAIIMLAVGTALLLAAVAASVYQYVGMRESMVREMTMLTEMIGENSTAALSFEDYRSAQELLRSLRAHPSVVVGAIYNLQGNLAAHYVRTDSTEPAPETAPVESSGFRGDRLFWIRPVMLNGQVIGTVYLATDLRILHEGVLRTLVIMLLVAAISGVAAFLMGCRLQRVISDPIIHLVQTAKAVTLLRNYAIRAHKSSSDELGMLIDGFNEMLSQIQQRDSALRRHRESLEAEICARTSELRRVNEELREARDRSDEGSRAKSEFLANMSHEIRTPMNGILGMTELALGTELSEEQREHIATVRACAEGLLTILNDILDFSKIEAGKLELDPVAFRPRDCIESVVGLVEFQARQKGLDLRAVVADAVPEYVIGDPTRLGQVLLNLTGNALKFTERGSIRIEAELKEAAGDEVVLEFSVRDTGIGIPPDKQRHIFEAFAQADGSMSRRFGGTGLGLTISSRLVSLMGGRIWVESEPGAGSTFRFTVCFHAAVSATPAVPAAPAAKPWRHLRLLVAEDNPVNQQVIVRLLARLGHAVEVAGTGREALEVLARGRFDAVLMDVQMPEMTGLEAAQAIRRTEAGSGRHVPIVALTAHAMKGDRDRCLAHGMDAYLAKPIRAAELAGVLSDVASGASHGSAG